MRNFNKTLFQNGKFNMYGLIRMFKQGADILIKPTLRCNLACDYCGCEVPGASCYMSPAPDKPLKFWQDRFTNDIERRYKIRQVTISGGEPFLYKEIVGLTEWLVGRGYLVYFFSNLTTTRGLKIKSSNRIKILATLHKDAVARGFKDTFYMNLKSYSRKFYVIKQELVDDLPAVGTNENLKELVAEDESNHRTYDSWGPNGEFYAADKGPDKPKYDAWRRELQNVKEFANPNRERLIAAKELEKQ